MTLPKRAHGRRRDRHGRGIRGPILDLDSPAYRTRAQKFDDILAWELNAFRTYLGSRLNRYDFAVIDVPPTDPARGKTVFLLHVFFRLSVRQRFLVASFLSIADDYGRT